MTPVNRRKAQRGASLADAAADDVSTKGEWSKPSRLVDELRPVKPFDAQLLPPSLRPVVLDISDRMQTPPDYAAAAVVVSLAGCVNRRASIQPKERDSTWIVVPNLWGTIIAPPGFMKSPMLRSVNRATSRFAAPGASAACGRSARSAGAKRLRFLRAVRHVDMSIQKSRPL
jgi:hypothetical protein